VRNLRRARAGPSCVALLPCHPTHGLGRRRTVSQGLGNHLATLRDLDMQVMFAQ
jgi:hypothetical protein